LYCNRLKDSI